MALFVTATSGEESGVAFVEGLSRLEVRSDARMA